MIVRNCTLLKPLACNKDETVVNVAKKLADAKQRRIIVVDGEKPIGIISTTDMNNRVVAVGIDPATATAKDIMSELLVICDADEHLAGIYEKMVENTSFFCPVTENDKLVGILTYGELAEHVEECLSHE